jgi:1-acyl-sn-glycerol-3-phosphate acyltransferase
VATLKRRLITIPAAFILLPVFVFFAPFVIFWGLIRDAVGKRVGHPTARLWLYGIVWLAHEWIAISVAAALSVVRIFSKAKALAGYHWMQGWWMNAVLVWARRLLRIALNLPEPPAMPEGQLIIISRHASPVDAIIPAWLLPRILNRPVHYVIKRELLWMPSIDLFGGQLGNHFVTRGGNTDHELAAITRLGQMAEPDAALVIFPEGTYSTSAARERVRKSLRSRGEDDLADLADSLVHLLPPKLAGFEAFLDAAPEASVVVMGHAGLEGVAELSSLRHALPLEKEVIVRWWEIPRCEVPDDSEGRKRWLHSEWRKLDAWLESCQEDDQAI